MSTDPAERIIGVHSSSDLEPVQQDGFPKALEKLQWKKSYSEWEFVFEPPKQGSKKTGTATNTGSPCKAPVRPEPQAEE